MNFGFIILFLISLSTTLMANDCPDLSGSYQCPGEKGRDPFLMEVSQKTVGNVTTYEYVYGGGVNSFTQKVSDAGEINAGPTSSHYIARCGGTRVNYFTSADDRLFCWDAIDEEGHYIETVIRNGTETLYTRCLREKLNLTY